MPSVPQPALPCWVFKSPRKSEMYLYLTDPQGFGSLPKGLRDAFGTPELVMELDLHPDRRLARADIGEVLNALNSLGFYLQLPPKLEPRLYQGE